jgi:hypothetical protein
MVYSRVIEYFAQCARHVTSIFDCFQVRYADLNGREGMQTQVAVGDSPTPDPDYVAPSESNIVKRSDISALNFGLRATYAFPIMHGESDSLCLKPKIVVVNPCYVCYN